jgi:hypothetical protein
MPRRNGPVRSGSFRYSSSNFRNRITFRILFLRICGGVTSRSLNIYISFKPHLPAKACHRLHCYHPETETTRNLTSRWTVALASKSLGRSMGYFHRVHRPSFLHEIYNTPWNLTDVNSLGRRLLVVEYLERVLHCRKHAFRLCILERVRYPKWVPKRLHGDVFKNYRSKIKVFSFPKQILDQLFIEL